MLLDVLLLAAFLTGLADDRRVARVELPAPGHSPFTLHATIPVPKGTWPRADAKSILRVQNHDAAKTPVPAQIEIVSRYPSGEADVIEIVVRVELAPEEHENQRVAYWVLQDEPQELAPFHATAKVEALLARGSRNLLLRTQDVFGNVYLADLCGSADDQGFGSLRLIKDGRWERELRLAATLAPSMSKSAEGEPLPHMMGVHAYFTQRADDDVVSLDLRVHNGCTSGSRAPSPLELFVGALYWHHVELLVPAEWSLVPQLTDPFLGETRDEGRWHVIPLVKPLPDGKLHFMPPQAQFERRLALAPAGKESLARDELRHDGLAFAQRGEGLWSWFDPATARYFPQRALLASVDFFARGNEHGKAAVRTLETQRMREYTEAITSGTPKGWYTYGSVMGWAHPWFISQQGGPGGEAIFTVEGYYAAAAASREGYTHLDLVHRMNVSRQSEAAYDRFGDQVGYHAWLDKEGRIPFDFRLNGGIRMPMFLLPMHWGPPVTKQVEEVIRRGLRPPYDQGNWYETNGQTPDRPDNLLAWWPHDDQHMVRYTKNAKALVWLGNDAMAKDDLILSGELFRLMFHESPHIEASWSKGVTLRLHEEIVKAHPHQGAWIGRENAWGIDSVCAAYSVAPPAWREQNRSWFDHVSQLLLDAAMPNGIVQRFVNNAVLGHSKYACTQTFETLFLIHAMRCMNESVYRGVDDKRREALEELALKQINYLYWGQPWARQQSEWQPDPAHPTLFVQGPRWGIAVGNNDNYETPPFSDATKWGPNFLPADGLGGGVEFFHAFWVLDWARQITEGKAGSGLENKYMKRTLACWYPHASYAELMKALAQQAQDESLDNSANWITFLGALQALGVR